MEVSITRPDRNREDYPGRAERAVRRLIRACALTTAAAGLCLWATPPADAQQRPPDTLAVVLAALDHTGSSLPDGQVMLDPRLVCSATLTGWSCPSELETTVAELGMVLGSREFTYLCATGSSGCRLVGTDVLVELTDLRLFGRTATVRANVWWDTGDAERPVGRRRSHLHLQRNDDWSWRVTGEDILVPESGP